MRISFTLTCELNSFSSGLLFFFSGLELTWRVRWFPWSIFGPIIESHILGTLCPPQVLFTSCPKWRQEFLSKKVHPTNDGRQHKHARQIKCGILVQVIAINGQHERRGRFCWSLHEGTHDRANSKCSRQRRSTASAIFCPILQLGSGLFFQGDSPVPRGLVPPK
jgi:hypothetical protein